MARLERVSALIVDDSIPMRTLLRGALVGFGVKQIREAGEPHSALSIIEKDKIDLVLVDYLLGTESGANFCRAIRSHEDDEVRHLPLIMVSGYARHARILEAINCGIDEYLVKPVTPRDLASRINAVIERRRPFYRTPTFYGPDRRRRADPKFKGPFRRIGDEGDLEL